MAVLETIRVKFGIVITVLIAIALLSFIIDPTSIQSVVGSKDAKQTVGEINGKKISYIDFSEEYERVSSIYGSSNSDDNSDQLRAKAWEEFFYRNLIFPTAKKAGFNVSDGEMYQLMSGNLFSPVIYQQFGGQMTPDYLRDFENNVILADPSGKMQMIWDDIAGTVKKQQFDKKYIQMVAQSSLTNDLMELDQIKNANKMFSVDFVSVPYESYGRDTTIKVTDQEIEEYYNKHQNLYRQNSSRDIEYVVFEVLPSAEDIASAKSEIEGLYEEFKTTENMRSFLSSNSERGLDNKWYKEGELTAVSEDVNDFVFESKETVSEIFDNGTIFQAVKVMETGMVPDQVFVKKIYLDPINMMKTDSLMTIVSAANIDELIAQYSFNPQDNGRMEPLNNYAQVSSFDMNKPFITSEMVEGQRINIINLVTDKSELVAKKKVAVLEVIAEPSDETRSGYYAQANELASKSAGKYEAFQQAVKEANLYAHPMKRIPENSSELGAVKRTREITRWAFDAEKGSVSNIFTIDNKYYIVASVTGIHEEGYAPVSEVRDMIEPVLFREKAADKKLAEVTEKIAGLTTLEEMAEALGTTVSSKADMTFASSDLDPKFAGYASVAAEGMISSPVKGSNAIYIYTVTSSEEGSYFKEEDLNVRKQQLDSRFVELLSVIMIEEGDVKDHTALYF